jgi:hypothetical protein
VVVVVLVVVVVVVVVVQYLQRSDLGGSRSFGQFVQ